MKRLPATGTHGGQLPAQPPTTFWSLSPEASGASLWLDLPEPEPSAPIDEAGVWFFAAEWRSIFLGALRVGDISIIAVTGIASFWICYGSFSPSSFDWWQILAACLLGTKCLYLARAYSVVTLRERACCVARIIAGWSLTVIALAAVLTFTEPTSAISPGRLLLWAVIGLVLLSGARLAHWAWLARWSKSGKLVANVAVLDYTMAAATTARRYAATSETPMRLLAAFRAGSSVSPSRASDGTDALLRLARRVRLDEVLVCVSSDAVGNFYDAFVTLAQLPVDIRIFIEPDNGAAVVPIRSLVLYRRPLAGSRIVMKRAMDVALGTALLLVFGPLMLAIALLIKLDSRGPILFQQRRLGFNKQPFTIYKFRTMHRGAEDPTVPQARQNDPRVTRFGRFLRRSSLDELPQLFNVLVGTMSLIGPRPHAIAHDEKYASVVNGYLARQRVRPGITGWAQVNGFRGETDTLEKMAERIDHDLFYIEHWSPLFDLWILVLTVLYGFHHPNAY